MVWRSLASDDYQVSREYRGNDIWLKKRMEPGFPEANTLVTAGCHISTVPSVLSPRLFFGTFML